MCAAIGRGTRRMIGVDFREPSLGEHVQLGFTAVLRRARYLGPTLIVFGLLSIFLGVEALRLWDAVRAARLLEDRRETLAHAVHSAHVRIDAVQARRTALLGAQALRRSSVLLAARIATVSDLLGSTMALTQLRTTPGGFDIEGRGTDLIDIRASLARLESGLAVPATFELRRDAIEPNALSFHFGFASK